MGAEILPFTYDGRAIRTVSVDGDPWFVAADICTALGIANHRDALGRLDDDEKGVGTTDTLGGIQQTAIISEPGIYHLAATSRRPEAKPFVRWLSHDVVPSIRKTGSYGTPVLATPEQRMAAAVLEAQTIIAAKDGRIAELEGPAESWQHFASTDGDLSVNETAKVLSRHPGIAIGETRLWKWLDVHKWTYKDAAGDRRPYQDRIDSGHLTTRARGHHHPSTGEWVIDAPQVRVPMKGMELLRKHLASSLNVVAS